MSESTGYGRTHDVPDSKLKHLEFIQGVITRMSTNSFLFKGWAITVAVGLSAFATTSSSRATKAALGAAIVSTFLFWGLDGYYLWIECRYRCLYKRIAESEPDPGLTMEAPSGAPVPSWLSVCRRWHLALLYGVIIAGEIVGLAISSTRGR